MLSARAEHCKLGAFIALDSVSLLSKRHSIVVISDRQRKCLNRLMLFIGFNAKIDRDGDPGATTDSALFQLGNFLKYCLQFVVPIDFSFIKLSQGAFIQFVSNQLSLTSLK